MRMMFKDKDYGWRKERGELGEVGPCHRLLGIPGKERRRRTNKRSDVCK
jgi:hypothetical protein